MKKIRITPVDGRVLTLPNGIPNIGGRRISGAQPAIPKHDIEATAPDEPLELDYDEMPDDAAAKLRGFLRKRELAGDCIVQKLPAAAPAPTPNLAAPRPSSATTTARADKE